MASVTSYGGAQALRCLALARRAMPSGTSRVSLFRPLNVADDLTAEHADSD